MDNRLCSLRELAIPTGFPSTYRFFGSSWPTNTAMGDAVPPLIVSNRRGGELVLPPATASYAACRAAEYLFYGLKR